MTFGFVIVVILPVVPCYEGACMVMKLIAHIVPVFSNLSQDLLPCYWI